MHAQSKYKWLQKVKTIFKRISHTQGTYVLLVTQTHDDVYEIMHKESGVNRDFFFYTQILLR